MHVKRLCTEAVTYVYTIIETAFFKSYLVYPGCYHGYNHDKRRSQEVKEKKLYILKKDKRMNETQEIKTLNETRG